MKTILIFLFLFISLLGSAQVIGKKISQLPLLTSPVDTNDVLPIVDNGITKQVTVATLLKADSLYHAGSPGAVGPTGEAGPAGPAGAPGVTGPSGSGVDTGSGWTSNGSALYTTDSTQFVGIGTAYPVTGLDVHGGFFDSSHITNDMPLTINGGSALLHGFNVKGFAANYGDVDAVIFAGDGRNIGQGDTVVFIATHQGLNHLTISDSIIEASNHAILQNSDSGYLQQSAKNIIQMATNTLVQTSGKFTSHTDTSAITTQYLELTTNNGNLMFNDTANITGNKTLSLSSQLTTIDANAAGASNNTLHHNGNITSNVMIFGGDSIYGNLVDSNSSINSNTLMIGSKINYNTLDSLGGGNGGSIFNCYLYDDAYIAYSILSGKGVYISNICSDGGTLDGNLLTGDYSAIDAITQGTFDHIDDNVLSASQSPTHGFVNQIENIKQFGKSSISYCTISDTTKAIIDIIQQNGSITYANNITIKSVVQINSQLDLTGFSHDIINENLENGKGWFSRQYAFNNLAQDSSVYLNVIPYGGRITRIILIGSGISGSANLQAGLETDDENLIAPTSVSTINSTPQLYNNISNAATDNRSLKLNASGNSIVSGSINVFVEFIY